MFWTGVTTLFFVSTFKFLFAPFGWKAFDLTFWETYISCVSGAILSASCFYFSANFFMKRAAEKRRKLYQDHLENGTPFKKKKVFTRMNKFVVRIKRSLGIYGTSLWAPLFLSVPIGSIITAKFYGKDVRTFPLIMLGMGINGMITTGMAYFIF